MTLGESARKARETAGLTQNKLSEISGVSASTIFNIEKDARNPAVLSVEALALALNISMEEYIGSEIDCVHVVRCRNCRKRNTRECAMCYVSDDGKEKYGWENDNDFCSYGERKENG